MKWLAVILFVLPIYLPIVNNCNAFVWIDPLPIWPPSVESTKCAVVEAPQPCTNVCDGEFCWPPCMQYPGASAR